MTKRGIDIVVSLIFLILLGPVLALVALLIRLDSDGPAVFSQWRVGRGHRLFRLYKLRTMRHGAEGDSVYLHDGNAFFSQVENDPRLTRIGRLLRKLSIDEMPQLWNVLRGEMSLIGPRPLILEESNRIPPKALARLLVRPGITGYAQAEGRSQAHAVERFARDVYYVEHASHGLDMRIALRTVRMLLQRSGVY